MLEGDLEAQALGGAQLLLRLLHLALSRLRAQGLIFDFVCVCGVGLMGLILSGFGVPPNGRVQGSPDARQLLYRRT